jgi:hypothetical protein
VSRSFRISEAGPPSSDDGSTPTIMCSCGPFSSSAPNACWSSGSINAVNSSEGEQHVCSRERRIGTPLGHPRALPGPCLCRWSPLPTTNHRQGVRLQSWTTRLPVVVSTTEMSLALAYERRHRSPSLAKRSRRSSYAGRGNAPDSTTHAQNTTQRVAAKAIHRTAPISPTPVTHQSS